MNQKVLFSWIGQHDLDAESRSEDGPVLSCLKNYQFDQVKLLYNYSTEKVKPYLDRLRKEVHLAVDVQPVELTSPVHFGDIYESVTSLLDQVNSKHELHILLSPGTPAMQAVWILLGKTRYPAVFYQSSREKGVELVDIPFHISAEYIPAAKKLNTESINQLSNTDIPEHSAFRDIATESVVMKEWIQKAEILADHDVPVLIMGESGTGKELFAKAIHNASKRASEPFIAVNCGAFPTELIDSMLFGHKKGAFTGAVADKAGFFEQADGGTLFLDEFGELQPAVQVRLLRVLQEKSFTRLGDSVERKSDFRLISATHKNLMQQVAEGVFREDLFFRVAIGVIQLPPLRDRGNDLIFLAERLLRMISEEYPSMAGISLSENAKRQLRSHHWPGNVRELKSTLVRAALWARSCILTDQDIEQAVFQNSSEKQGILGRPIRDGFSVESVMSEVAKHYIEVALCHSKDNKTKAAKLLGLKSSQVLTNWIVKHKVDCN